jgi:hypothetical protein
LFTALSARLQEEEGEMGEDGNLSFDRGEALREGLVMMALRIHLFSLCEKFHLLVSSS